MGSLRLRLAATECTKSKRTALGKLPVVVCYCISRTLIGNGQYVTNVTPLNLRTVNENFDVTNDVTVKSLIL